MTRHAILFALLLLLSCTARLHAQSPSEIMEEVMQERSAHYCNALGPVFFFSVAGADDADVRVLAARCYTAKARLHLNGDEQDVLLRGTTISELPVRMIEAASKLNLDVYRPLAGVTINE